MLLVFVHIMTHAGLDILQQNSKLGIVVELYPCKIEFYCSSLYLIYVVSLTFTFLNVNIYLTE